MVYLYSTYIKENEGYEGITQFNFNLDYFEDSQIIEVSWIWGDGTFTTDKSLEAAKVYQKAGQYNVSLKLIHMLPGGKKPQTYIWQGLITIKKPYDTKFSITTTADPSKPIVYARATKINLIPQSDLYGENGEKIKFIQWDLGNGIISNNFSLMGVTYDQPGMYEITMLVYDLDGNENVSKQLITVEEYLNDSLKFVRVPPPTYAGHLNRYPFKIEITSTISSENHVIDLYAQFSKSQALLHYPTKYSFLRPQWRFLNLNLDPIKFISTTDTEVRIDENGKEVKEGGVVVGVRGYAEFYFVDDWYNFDQVLDGQQCTTLWATLRSDLIRSNKLFDNVDGLHPGQANNTAQAWCPYVTLWRKPDTLQITSNGLDPVPEIQWAGSDIPLVVKIGYKNATIEDVHNSEGIIKLANPKESFAHYVPNNISENVYLDLDFSNKTLPVSAYLNPSEYPLKIKYQDENQFFVGGYYKTIFERKEPGVVSLSASLSAYEPVLYGQTYNPFLWLPNATNATVAIAQYIFTSNAIINSPQYFYTNEISTYKQFFDKTRRKINTVKKNPNLNTALVNNANLAVKKKNYVSSIYDNKNRLSGLYATAALNAPTYHAWISDVENDLIYRITTNGKIYNAIKLQEVLSSYSKAKFTPHSMVVDKDLNLFVALYDARMIVKFNDAGVLVSVLQLEYSASPVCIDVGPDNTVFVSCLYSDSKFAAGSSGSVIRYNNALTTVIGRRDYASVEPGNIIADADGNVYVVCGGHLNRKTNQYIYRTRSYIEKISWQSPTPVSKGPLFPDYKWDDAVIWDDYTTWCDTAVDGSSTFSKYNTYPAIRHLCLDKYNNIFFTYGYNNVGKINQENGKFSFCSIKPVTSNDKVNSSILDGLAYNINHKIYAINSLDNKVVAIDPDTMLEEASFYVNPSKIEYEADSNGDLKIINNRYIPRSSPYTCSLRANGDWTGWRWSYKYSYKPGGGMYTLSGVHKNIWLAQHEAYKFFTKTENFDMAKHMRSFSFMPVLQNSPFLYDNQYVKSEATNLAVDSITVTRSSINERLYNADKNGLNDEQIAELKEELNLIDANIKSVRDPLKDQKGFFGSIFGSYPYEPSDLGIRLYDKIANFLSNTSDPDTCDLNHLQEMIRKINFDDKDFKFYFPEGLSRIVDICSVNPKRLTGIICNCGDTYNRNEYNAGLCTYCGREKLTNRGQQIFSNTYTVTAGAPVILKTKATQKYRKISTGKLNNQNEYSLEVLASSIGLNEHWGIFYEFYEYIPNSVLMPLLSSSNYFIENIIDWNNQQTTLPRDQDAEEWYKEAGLIERMVNFELQKGLGLI